MPRRRGTYFKNQYQRKRYIDFRNRNEKDPEFLLYPCFDIDPSTQLKENPTTGEEYILKVMTERKNCAAVVRCQQDFSELAKNQTRFVEVSNIARAPEILRPTKEWQDIQVADFSDLRLYISRLRANPSIWPNDVQKPYIWSRTSDDWKLFFKSNDPTLTLTIGMSQGFLYYSLQYIIEILEEVKEDTIDDRTGQWIYSLLACLNQQLPSETYSVLRDLARKCAEIRTRVNPEDNNAIHAAMPMNIFICLVARYFRQLDLAD